ncbi:ferredoxin [Actinophytocola algeriensis]|uniref:Sulfoxide reductase heme-binding subunit YedZ n=1 Tax=Actinophytocola algeriensis TaxID=1768010 RepID=A0A7W7VH02_9PSEU|nr:ferredoxin [Actinophytocola algeriensis]MBB4909674.1 sulfoxide reductase heme-binding subunit YedZ [Actinophytocola algeriensis]MBE1475664.1 sulfoxide reductase heme-binding subunit YedZ [Actinophytocola algeriensis]
MKHSYRVSVDNDRCRRFGICADEAAQLFRLTPRGGLNYQRAVPADALEAAQAAVRSCPTLAISLEERR